MMIDKQIQKVHDFLTGKEIRWHDFSEVGIEEHYHDYYYAEDRLYLIRDHMVGSIYFIEAGSPGEALQVIKHRWDSVNNLGSDEDYYY